MRKKIAVSIVLIMVIALAIWAVHQPPATALGGKQGLSVWILLEQRQLDHHGNYEIWKRIPGPFQYQT